MIQPIFCPRCSLTTLPRPLYLVRWNDALDHLFECLNVACGYTAAYRMRTGQFEPPVGQPSEGWQPPLCWRPPQPIGPTGPPAAENSTSPVAEPATGACSSGQYDPTQPAGAEPAAHSRAVASTEAAADPENGETHDDDARDTLARQTQDVRVGDASTNGTAEGIPDNPKATADARPAPGTDAGGTARNGQRRPRGRAEQTSGHVRALRAQMEKLRVHPNLDPIRRARALGQLAHEALQAIDVDSRLAAKTQRRSSLDLSAIRKRERTIAYLRRVLVEEMKKLQTHPDLDPVSKAQAAARLAREAGRAIQLQGLVADMSRSLLNFAAMVEKLRRGDTTIKDPRRRLDAERAEMSADEPRESAEIRHPDVRCPVGSERIVNEPKTAKQFLAESLGVAEEGNDFCKTTPT